MPKCTYEQCLPSGYTENGKNQEFKSTKTSQTHYFGKLKRLASSTVLVYQNSSFSTVLALQKGVKIQKYFPGSRKYDVSAFQCTFDHVHIFKTSEATPD